jgi:hypothetical protein
MSPMVEELGVLAGDALPGHHDLGVCPQPLEFLTGPPSGAGEHCEQVAVQVIHGVIVGH